MDNNQHLKQQQLNEMHAKNAQLISQGFSQQMGQTNLQGGFGVSQNSVEETYLAFIKQQDIAQLQTQWDGYSQQQNFSKSHNVHNSHLSEEEESQSLFSRGFEGFPMDQVVSNEHQNQAWQQQQRQYQTDQSQHHRNQGVYQMPIQGYQMAMPLQHLTPQDMLGQGTGVFQQFDGSIKDTRIASDHQNQDASSKHQALNFRPGSKTSASKLPREWQSEGKDIIIKLGSENEAIIILNTITHLISQLQTPEAYKVKVSRVLESIQEKDDSDNNGSSNHSGEKNDPELNFYEFAQEQKRFLEQGLDDEEDQGEPQVEYFKDDEQQKIFFQTSPFFIGKTQGYMAQSLTEKTPIAFNVENEYGKTKRAFTPLDQITTGVSDEDTLHYNLSGNLQNYSFNQSNEAFQAFHQRPHQSSEDSGSFHSAHANIPNHFNVQLRQSHDIQNLHQMRQSFPVYNNQQISYIGQIPQQIQRHSNPQQNNQQFIAQIPPNPFNSMIIPQQTQPLLPIDQSLQPSGTSFVLNSIPNQQYIIKQMQQNDPAFQQMTRNLQYTQQQSSWPYPNNIQTSQLQAQQQQLQNQILQQQQKLQSQRMDFQKLSEQQAFNQSRIMAQEFKKQSNSYENQQQQQIAQDLSQGSLQKQFSQLHIQEEKKESTSSMSNYEKDQKPTTKNDQSLDYKPSSSFASNNTDDRTKNEVDITRIMNNEESRTTIMIRNIPNKFKQMTLLEMINERHQNKYDYFYLPMDLKTQCNVGYAFINFVHPIYILDFFLEFQSIEWQNTTHDCKSVKISKLAFANIQGKDELVQHHFDKNIMKKTEEQIKPLVLESNPVPEEEIKKIKNRYISCRHSGELDKKLAKLQRKQRKAAVHNGPHPHHQPSDQSNSHYSNQIQHHNQGNNPSSSNNQNHQSSQQNQGSVRSVTQQASHSSRGHHNNNSITYGGSQYPQSARGHTSSTNYHYTSGSTRNYGGAHSSQGIYSSSGSKRGGNSNTYHGGSKQGGFYSGSSSARQQQNYYQNQSQPQYHHYQ
ncbi:UNKNOWN [Stylonychia lemnae]|uniref:Mei2-like C-terminal RNA recognition motif domain-containing protein n=1 Tax=Stylonychia lemnae TaxID=5949 RepID=A0A078AMC8_STYLE|nr:UNKNOWN [Stylonychia lemnae]|eukprot:CDW82003.1 UNKNOWN [Stylonychia lemnae]